MTNIEGVVVDLPRVSASIPPKERVSGSVGAKIINIGEDGATFVPSVSPDGTVSWTNDKGLPNPEPVNIKGKDGYTPIKGIDYVDGKNGKDGYTPIKGKDYFDGKAGYTPVKWKDSFDGKDGYTPVKGIDYFDGEDGKNGKDGYTPVKGKDYFDGEDGRDGEDGHTPVKGVDYFTDADKAEMVSAVIDSLPVYNGEVVAV